MYIYVEGYWITELHLHLIKFCTSSYRYILHIANKELYSVVPRGGHLKIMICYNWFMNLKTFYFFPFKQNQKEIIFPETNFKIQYFKK